MDNDNFNKQSNDLIGDILKDFAKTGGMDNLKGAGKPISEEYFSGDIFQHFQKVAKDAGYKPYWLTLQHEIRDELQDIAKKYATGEKEGLHFRVTKVNEKIIQYNKVCPPPMQKGTVRLETIDIASSRWS
ncbi:DnaJ family domain-containing protein [Psychrobacillus antarcticus]|uniref:DnaJ family domain-containing protein n=1 Tax=Psychrobacillus antarcticus TaxID=2879115 RepID=UPI002407D149|nr:DnaJ family domain-containing protein [Psychrobacillus antarcticus]